MINRPPVRGTQVLTALATFPYRHEERATAALRAELQRRLMAGDLHSVPAWSTFAVTGPRQFTDLRGRTWFEYRATVQTHGPFDLPGLGGTAAR